MRRRLWVPRKEARGPGHTGRVGRRPQEASGTLGASVGDVGGCSPFPCPHAVWKKRFHVPVTRGLRWTPPTPVQDTSCQGDPGYSLGVSG